MSITRVVRLAPLIFEITGLFYGLCFSIYDCFSVFLKHPIFCLLVGDVFTHIVVMIPSFLMENDLFTVDNSLAIFNVYKAVALVFNLGSVEEAANTEEAGL